MIVSAVEKGTLAGVLVAATAGDTIPKREEKKNEEGMPGSLSPPSPPISCHCFPGSSPTRSQCQGTLGDADPEVVQTEKGERSDGLKWILARNPGKQAIDSETPRCKVVEFI